MKEAKVTLGQKYRDTMHGIEGIAVSRTEYLTACTRVCLETRDGNDIKDNYFDENMLEGIEIPKKERKKENRVDLGKFHPPEIVNRIYTAQ
jgi:hypothetical protein